MSVRQIFLQETIDGRPYVNLFDWLKTLSESEQAEFRSAEKRQLGYREEAIARGDMIIDPDTNDYVWKDEEAASRGKPTDDVWYDYFERWRKDCGIADASKLETDD